jgi:hypothetical protein
LAIYNQQKKGCLEICENVKKNPQKFDLEFFSKPWNCRLLIVVDGYQFRIASSG